MDKGIRPACNAKFLELLPQRATLGNTEFRRAVMNSIMEDFGCRPEEKNNGGRKKKEEQSSDVVVNDLDPMPEEQLLFTVKKKGDGSVVAEGLTLEDARELCNKAKIAKKAALYWV
jgi:hypothetical protein